MSKNSNWIEIREGEELPFGNGEMYYVTISAPGIENYVAASSRDDEHWGIQRWLPEKHSIIAYMIQQPNPLPFDGLTFVKNEQK